MSKSVFVVDSGHLYDIFYNQLDYIYSIKTGFVVDTFMIYSLINLTTFIL